MGAVTEGAMLAVLTSAKIDRSGLIGRVLNRGYPSVLVAAVTKRLLATAPTRTPVIVFTCLNFDRVGRLLGNNGLGHDRFLQNMRSSLSCFSIRTLGVM